jgi:hypothetical protein
MKRVAIRLNGKGEKGGGGGRDETKKDNRLRLLSIERGGFPRSSLARMLDLPGQDESGIAESCTFPLSRAQSSFGLARLP